jgi:hypothetical protein
VKNVTIAIDAQTLAASREYARAHHTSLNTMIRELLERTVAQGAGGRWAEEFLAVGARAGGDSCGKTWKRKDLYRG